jgi:hypothetical protein
MAAIAFHNFHGEVPKSEPHLLPNESAQLALNCDFESGALTPLRNGQLLATMVNNPIKGIYTEDGINFYTWVAETYAFRSPIIDDAYNRMFYLTPSAGLFSAATTLAMAANGPTPLGGNSWRAGVPSPTVAPVLALLERTTLPDYPSITITAESWWESGSNTYNRGAATVTQVSALRSYTISKPATTGVPTGMTLAVKFNLLDAANAGREIMSLVVRSGSTARSNSLPGTVEASLADASGGTASLTLLWGVAETRAYAYTNQNTWGEEGSNSPPATISTTYLQDVKVTVAAVDFTGYRPFAQYNIYRTYGNKTYLKTAPSGTGLVYTDASHSPVSGAIAMESADWTPPPAGLQGAAQMPNGWFAAFKGNTLYMSEPYRPHAWPYSMTFTTNIRGICAGANLVVTTADGVNVVNGSFPASASQVKPAVLQAGNAQRSMAAIDGAVAYASNDGIALVMGQSVTMDASQRLFTRLTWRARYSDILLDASMRFSYFDGRLVMTSNSQPKGFILRLDEDVGSLSELNELIDCTFQLSVTDSLYYSLGANVYLFQGGTNKTFDWWSKDFIFKKDEVFGAGYIRCASDTLMTLYADGVQVYQATLQTGYFRIVDLNLATRWSVRLSGAGKVSEFYIARTLRELQDV